MSAAEMKDYSKALAICEEILAANPELPEAFRTRSRIHARMKQFDLAVLDLTRAIQTTRAEPSDYFFRGWWNLEQGDVVSANEDLTMAITLGNELNLHDFDESAYFFRAITFLRLNQPDDALRDCEKVRDDFLIYLRSGKVSKSDIINEARIPPKRFPPAK
jgi:tetratricopeptide (TPR) repeat protein